MSDKTELIVLIVEVENTQLKKIYNYNNNNNNNNNKNNISNNCPRRDFA